MIIFVLLCFGAATNHRRTVFEGSDLLTDFKDFVQKAINTASILGESDPSLYWRVDIGDHPNKKSLYLHGCIGECFSFHPALSGLSSEALPKLQPQFLIYFTSYMDTRWKQLRIEEEEAAKMGQETLRNMMLPQHREVLKQFNIVQTGKLHKALQESESDIESFLYESALLLDTFECFVHRINQIKRTDLVSAFIPIPIQHLVVVLFHLDRMIRDDISIQLQSIKYGHVLSPIGIFEEGSLWKRDIYITYPGDPGFHRAQYEPQKGAVVPLEGSANVQSSFNTRTFDFKLQNSSTETFRGTIIHSDRDRVLMIKRSSEKTQFLLVKKSELLIQFSHFTSLAYSEKIEKDGMLPSDHGTGLSTKESGIYFTSLGPEQLITSWGVLRNNYWSLYTDGGTVRDISYMSRTETQNEKGQKVEISTVSKREKLTEVQMKIWIPYEHVRIEGINDNGSVFQVEHGGSEVWLVKTKRNEKVDLRKLLQAEMEFVKLR